MRVSTCYCLDLSQLTDSFKLLLRLFPARSPPCPRGGSRGLHGVLQHICKVAAALQWRAAVCYNALQSPSCLVFSVPAPPVCLGREV